MEKFLEMLNASIESVQTEQDFKKQIKKNMKMSSL